MKATEMVALLAAAPCPVILGVNVTLPGREPHPPDCPCNGTGRRWPGLREECTGVPPPYSFLAKVPPVKYIHDGTCCDGSGTRDVEPRVAYIVVRDLEEMDIESILGIAMQKAGIEVSGGYRDARGAAPPPPGTDSPEARIRNLRG